MAKLDNKFESSKQDWETPSELFNQLNKEFHFTLDLAASEHNKKCEKYLDESIDSIKQSWTGVCWLNPPYGNDREHRLSNWVKKSFLEAQKDDCTVVMLVPARTNTNWWHEYVMKSAEVRLICGRPKFVGAKHGLPQPLALVIFRKGNKPTKFSTHWM